jgi:hypothetical protein
MGGAIESPSEDFEEGGGGGRKGWMIARKSLVPFDLAGPESFSGVMRLDRYPKLCIHLTRRSWSNGRLEGPLAVRCGERCQSRE